jgi:hypothetical protein
LLEPALNNDWAQWRAALQQLETQWFSPLLAALKAGRLDRLGLIATHDTRATSYRSSKNALRKFWIKPSLKTLLS